ncbi:MAG TPA: lysophospholipid acyltransferase family protein [Pyrinomonadaceae bacterium]|jgi:KDO2-lipid IV(A) lauroyltransferase|nr:lysophospholipid acyltransferase family protein [Pyrinomonadaceae bacterium]
MGKHGKVQTAFEYGAARTLLTGLGWLPRPLALAAGQGIGRIAYTLAGRLRRTGERNLELALPGLDEAARARILRGCFANLGRLLGEFSHLPRATPESLRNIIECEGIENLEAARAAGRGVILFTGHLGAWELSSFALSAFGYPMSFLARRIDNPKVEGLIERTRTRFGNRSIDKRSAARPMLRTLRAGGIVGILVDLNTHPHEAIFVDFFGIPASTTSGLATLALRTGSAVLPVFIPWDEKRRRFVLRVDPPLEIERTGDEAMDVRRLTALFTSVIESYVRRFPDQWLWIHRRWNTRPAGEANFYATTPSPARLERQTEQS